MHSYIVKQERDYFTLVWALGVGWLQTENWLFDFTISGINKRIGWMSMSSNCDILFWTNIGIILGYIKWSIATHINPKIKSDNLSS